VGCFFQGFPHTAFNRALARIEVSGGIVEPQTVGSMLFHQQKASIALYDGCDGDMGFPACVHG
jgi:hypothetical protein